MQYVNSDRYLPSEDAQKQDILVSLKELGEKRIPGALMHKRAAAEIERLRDALKKIADTKDSVARSSIREYAASILQPTE